MTEALPPVDAALRGALLATLLLLGVALGRSAGTHVAARVGVALTAGLAVQALASLPTVERGWPIAWQAPLVAISIGNSVLFWLFARALFDDAFRVRPWQGAAWLAVMAVGAAFCLSMAGFGPDAAPTLGLRFVLRWIPAVFAALVVATAALQWRADLVERRRRFRAFIVAAGTAYALAMVAVRLTSARGVPSPLASALDTAALLAMALAAAVATLRIGGDGGLLSAPAPAETPAAGEMEDVSPEALDGFEAGLAADLDRLMRVDRAYRVDDLTLGVLALKLGVPEYRLRRFIHQRLGQRNFNAYVNGLRLAEVRAALADPARRGDGVLEIALEAGFASAGPFNRAFKAETGVTPTDFRRRALADS